MRELIKIYKALSDPNRLRILKMLEIRSLCVCEITSVLNLATSTVSKHLAILREANLIIDFKEGKWVNFQLNDSKEPHYPPAILKQLTGWLDDDKIVQQDALKVKAVDRHKICTTN
jgi:ArsR family transcriptional regulator